MTESSRDTSALHEAREAYDAAALTAANDPSSTDALTALDAARAAVNRLERQGADRAAADRAELKLKTQRATVDNVAARRAVYEDAARHVASLAEQGVTVQGLAEQLGLAIQAFDEAERAFRSITTQMGTQRHREWFRDFDLCTRDQVETMLVASGVVMREGPTESLDLRSFVQRRGEIALPRLWEALGLASEVES